MSSFGQGGFGQASIGGHPPSQINFLNISAVDAQNAVIELSADAPDKFEYLYFEAELSYGLLFQQIYPHADGVWNPLQTERSTRIRTATVGGSVLLETGEALDPSKWYLLTVRVTTDPNLIETAFLLEQTFLFQPIADPQDIEAITGFFLYESTTKLVSVLEGGTSNEETPFALWQSLGPHDYYAWNISLDNTDNALPNRTYTSDIDFMDTPLYDDTWHLKIARVYGGVLGPIFHFSFSVAGTEIVVS